MWNCKHCKKEFDFDTTSEKANHSRWCASNPKRNDTENLVKARERITQGKLGKLMDFEVNCYNCKEDIVVNEREKQFPRKQKYFCSRNCSNSEGGKAKADMLDKMGKLGYRSIAERNHKKECIVCGFDKIVEVHHVNEIHKDNSPSNLIWLCPNHHSMYHSRYKEEIVPYIEKYINGALV